MSQCWVVGCSFQDSHELWLQTPCDSRGWPLSIRLRWHPQSSKARLSSCSITRSAGRRVAAEGECFEGCSDSISCKQHHVGKTWLCGWHRSSKTSFWVHWGWCSTRTFVCSLCGQPHQFFEDCMQVWCMEEPLFRWCLESAWSWSHHRCNSCTRPWSTQPTGCSPPTCFRNGFSDGGTWCGVPWPCFWNGSTGMAHDVGAAHHQPGRSCNKGIKDTTTPNDVLTPLPKVWEPSRKVQPMPPMPPEVQRWTSRMGNLWRAAIAALRAKGSTSKAKASPKTLASARVREIPNNMIGTESHRLRRSRCRHGDRVRLEDHWMKDYWNITSGECIRHHVEPSQGVVCLNHMVQNAQLLSTAFGMYVWLRWFVMMACPMCCTITGRMVPGSNPMNYGLAALSSSSNPTRCSTWPMPSREAYSSVYAMHYTCMRWRKFSWWTASLVNLFPRLTFLKLLPVRQTSANRQPIGDWRHWRLWTTTLASTFPNRRPENKFTTPFNFIDLFCCYKSSIADHGLCCRTTSTTCIVVNNLGLVGQKSGLW